MKISVITVVYNNREHLEDTIQSVLSQTHQDVEYIVVDGGSDDGSLEIIQKYDKYISKWISEEDSGIYDAMNKGVSLSTGAVIGFLNSDDVYHSVSVLLNVSKTLVKDGADCCYGDIVYVSEDLKKTVRYWKAGSFSESKLTQGWMPPHPSFFVKRDIFDKVGLFRTDFRISADYEFMLRCLKKFRAGISYLPEILVKMRIGGRSNRGIRNLLNKSVEDFRAWKVNGLRISPFIVIKKPLIKINQFFRKGKL